MRASEVQKVYDPGGLQQGQYDIALNFSHCLIRISNSSYIEDLQVTVYRNIKI